MLIFYQYFQSYICSTHLNVTVMPCHITCRQNNNIKKLTFLAEENEVQVACDGTVQQDRRLLTVVLLYSFSFLIPYGVVLILYMIAKQHCT